MPPRDFERVRRELEKQFRADVEVLYSAYCAKLRAYEMMYRLPGGLGGLGDLDPRFPFLATPPLSLPALPSEETVPAPATPAVPAPVPPEPTPAPRRRSGGYELYDAMLAILDQLPETFTRGDVCAALGYEPSRSSLHRALSTLQRNGWLEKEERGTGRFSNLYRKTPDAPPEAPEPAEET
ncbi:MAG TPA: hypothetical protein VFE33_05975 [Thermoanaerobaculia bacterium]|nr:hypothetical protein [Thermoanaerobaculia bacterium]